MRMSHNKKIRLARRMRTPEEIRRRTSIWDTEYWNNRKAKIAEQVKQREQSNA